jgi:hypothetical protein
MEETQTAVATTPEGCGQAEPQKEHAWLHRMVGEWTCEGEAGTGEGQPPMKWKSTETVRSLGGLWILCEGVGEMPGGGEARTVVTLGYDPAKGRFAGTFVGSMMANMWVYDGELDKDERVLTLHTEGPSMQPGGGMAKYKDVVELKSDDDRTLTSLMQSADGQWVPVMSAVYRRTK